MTANTRSRLAARIDALLPQTQCRKCGYSGCKPYAEAIAGAGAQINRCPPGGDSLIHALAALTGRPALPLDTACGMHVARAAAWIDEARCIGCTLCIQACPVDAIVGAAKMVHGVIPRQCTGCELCLPPCPVDCIEMRPVAEPAWGIRQAAAARRRFTAREIRLQRGARPANEADPGALDPAARREVIAAARARVAAKRLARGGRGT